MQCFGELYIVLGLCKYIPGSLRDRNLGRGTQHWEGIWQIVVLKR